APDGVLIRPGVAGGRADHDTRVHRPVDGSGEGIGPIARLVRGETQADHLDAKLLLVLDTPLHALGNRAAVAGAIAAQHLPPYQRGGRRHAAYTGRIHRAGGDAGAVGAVPVIVVGLRLTVDQILPPDDLAAGKVLVLAVDPRIDDRNRVVLCGIAIRVAVTIARDAEVPAGLRDAKRRLRRFAGGIDRRGR